MSGYRDPLLGVQEFGDPWEPPELDQPSDYEHPAVFGARREDPTAAARAAYSRDLGRVKRGEPMTERHAWGHLVGDAREAA